MSDEAGGYRLAMALGRCTQSSDDTLIVKTDATSDAQDMYLAVVQYWQGVLDADAAAGKKCSSAQFQADDNAANAAQAPVSSLVQTEEGVAGQIPQNVANILRSCTDIIALFSFVAQLQQSQQ